MTPAEHATATCRLCGESAPTPGHSPCCSSHGKDLCCPCYRRSHFVEVGPCCSTTAAERATRMAEAGAAEHRAETFHVDIAGQPYPRPDATEQPPALTVPVTAPTPAELYAAALADEAGLRHPSALRALACTVATLARRDLSNAAFGEAVRQALTAYEEAS